VTTIMVKGQDVKVGDDLWFLGRPHRITRIKPYTHPVTRGEVWRTAYSDGPAGMHKSAWGITLEYDHGYAAGYEVTYTEGDPRKENRPPEDDYPSPWFGEGARLWEAHRGEVGPGGWRAWLAAREAATPAGGLSL
jgi:hypothetical protein